MPQQPDPAYTPRQFLRDLDSGDLLSMGRVALLGLGLGWLGLYLYRMLRGQSL